MVVDILYDLYEGLKVAEEFVDTTDGYSTRSVISNKQRKAKTSGDERPLVLSRVRQIFVLQGIQSPIWWEGKATVFQHSASSQESLQGVRLSSQESVKLGKMEGREGGMNEHSFSSKLRCQEQN